MMPPRREEEGEGFAPLLHTVAGFPLSAEPIIICKTTITSTTTTNTLLLLVFPSQLGPIKQNDFRTLSEHFRMI